MIRVFTEKGNVAQTIMSGDSAENVGGILIVSVNQNDFHQGLRGIAKHSVVHRRGTVCASHPLSDGRVECVPQLEGAPRDFFINYAIIGRQVDVLIPELEVENESVGGQDRSRWAGERGTVAWMDRLVVVP